MAAHRTTRGRASASVLKDNRSNALGWRPQASGFWETHHDFFDEC